MGFFKHKPEDSTNSPEPKAVSRDYVEEIQRKAWQTKQAQAHMANLRSEAVQARRLAEQINNLSHHSPTPKRKKTMTDSTTIDSGKMLSKQRRASDKPRAAGARSSFNPLHPSMELPPEQLIRLLGLESKKIRKPKRAQATPVRKKAATATSLPSAPERAEPTPQVAPQPPARSTHRQREYECAKSQGSSKHRLGLWMPALVTGLVCGIAVSAYLFWLQPGNDAAARSPDPAANKVKISPTNNSRQKAPPVAAAKPKPTTVIKDDSAWLATIDAQAKRLRTEARQRFNRRLEQAPLTTTVPVVVTKIDVPPAPLTSAEGSTNTPPVTVAAKPADSALQTPEALNAEAINASESIDAQESSPAIDQTNLPDNVVVPVPATEPSVNSPETLPRENASELF